jgi:hypothetical protein
MFGPGFSESGSFLKKRTKKLLHFGRGVVGDSPAKVFASFFKKKRFLLLLNGTASAIPLAWQRPLIRR